MRLTRKQKLNMNPTVAAMRQGLMNYKRRMEVPMWHRDHLRHAITVLEDMTDELKRIDGSNSLRNVDKCIYAQGVIVSANKRFAAARPHDPRSRGAEQLVYDPHLIDTNGHEELRVREDLNEPRQRPDGRSRT